MSASYNDVFDNWMSNNAYGIYVRHCFLNSIFLNHISGNHWGIRLKGATYNQIYQNQIQNNVEGVYSCCGAMVNTLYKNNFVNNSENAYDDDTSNLYNTGIGNYWSDYLMKYPNAQSQDNIWDTSYSISGGKNFDRYPVVTPFSI
jgi:parallel beta-helix repeat protein